MRSGQNMGKIIMVVVLVAVVLGMGALLYTRSNALSASTNLNGLWYGSLSITRFDSSEKPSAHLSEAFYLNLSLHTDNSITGTYTTCSFTDTVKESALEEYTMQTGVLSPNGRHINLYLFAGMYGTLSGNTLSLQGERYEVHSDFITAEYASTLHKVAESTYLSACHVVAG
jgi:hypothetical protein